MHVNAVFFFFFVEPLAKLAHGMERSVDAKATTKRDNAKTKNVNNTLWRFIDVGFNHLSLFNDLTAFSIFSRNVAQSVAHVFMSKRYPE